MKSITEKLFEEYQEIRATDLTFNQFRILVRFFPSILVCMSDNKMNQEEWIGMLQNVKGLILSFEDLSQNEKDSLYRELLNEIMYLAQFSVQWKAAFLSAIRFELTCDPGDKEFILESMYLFANIHEGICVEEQLMIDELVNELHLSA
jgi:hypothetical protein